MKPGRNDPCPCGSGKKFKQCCINKTVVSAPAAARVPIPTPAEINYLTSLLNAKRYAELESSARALTSQYPASGFAWKSLGTALQMQHKNALEALQRAALLLPEDTEVQYDLGTLLMKLGNLPQAETCFRRVTEIKRNHAEALYSLGNVRQQLGQYAEAVTSYRQLLKLKPNHAMVLNNLASALKEVGQSGEAEEKYLSALKLEPNSALILRNYGSLLRSVMRLAEAEQYFLRALEVDPKCIPAMLDLGLLYIFNGAADQAEQQFWKVLEIEPGNLYARFLLTRTQKAKADDKNLSELIAREQAGKATLSHEDAFLLQFALGKCFDDLGDYDRAFPHFIEGSRLKRSTFQYDANQITRCYDEVIKIFNQDLFDRLRGAGNKSAAPIFVLGMPRSGTTLTEQIIASHPDVHGAGELPDLPRISQSTVAGVPGYPANIRALDHKALTQWADEYIGCLAQYAPNAKYVTDKMPDNFWLIGLIHLMLPNAKIIHVNRSPMDTCLSCFTTLFDRGLEQTYDLGEMGHYYHDYARLMDHWRSVLPAGAFLDVQYEDIVADLEPQARRIIDFCGLEWRDECLAFHKSERAIGTASMTQVRNPVYKSSLDRWRSYEQYLGPLKVALGDLSPE